MEHRKFILECLSKHDYKYICRNKDGGLIAHRHVPTKMNYGFWVCDIKYNWTYFLNIFSDVFPDIQWKDEIVLNIKKELEE